MNDNYNSCSPLVRALTFLLYCISHRERGMRGFKFIHSFWHFFLFCEGWGSRVLLLEGHSKNSLLLYQRTSNRKLHIQLDIYIYMYAGFPPAQSAFHFGGGAGYLGKTLTVLVACSSSCISICLVLSGWSSATSADLRSSRVFIACNFMSSSKSFAKKSTIGRHQETLSGDCG